MPLKPVRFSNHIAILGRILYLYILDAYQTENVKIFKQQTPPSYSFGSRTVYFKRDGIPGPNAYTVPQLFGSKIPTKSSAPAFSMSGRARVGGFSEDLRKVHNINFLKTITIY